ncbi:MAG: tetratricopeptide repeat protein [Rhodospirillales bacterium]|nr:tetratricopeptide repeat protein [Rhodospirillales bacterium]
MSGSMICPVMAQSPESAPVQIPSQSDLNDLDQQLANIQKAIEEANNQDQAAENGLPVIDSENDPDVFYDSVPVRRGVQPTAPEKVDPITRPAGKIVHVSKDFEADEDQAILVSAKRALALGRYDSALDFYEQLYKKNPRDARILMGKAIALQNLGHVQTAIKAYEELLNVQPDNLEAEVSMLGLVKTRFPAVALKRLLALGAKHPNEAGLSAQIGMSYAEMGNVRDALRYLGSAVSLEPNNAFYYYNMAVVSDRAGNLKDAIKYYEEALSKDTLYGGGRTVPREVVYERLSVIRARS